MAQPWYRILFHRRQTKQPGTRQTGTEHKAADPQLNLGQGLEQGKGTAVDDVEAVACYRKAASQNHASAQFNLGGMLADGRGVARDGDEARRWMLSAASQGHTDAQYELGVLHRRDGFKGSAQDAAESNVEAYRWFRLAAAGGHVISAAELENVTLRMTHEQILEGNRRADSFVSHPGSPLSAGNPQNPPDQT